MKRTEITVNGKKLEQLEKELAAPLPAGKLNYNENNEAYFPVEVYEERFREVLGGRRWYSISSGPASVSQVANRYLVNVSVKINIISDDNEVAWSNEANGGSNVILISKSGEPKSLKSEVGSATSIAIKNVYHMFGIGIEQLKHMKNQSNGQRTFGDAGRPGPASQSAAGKRVEGGLNSQQGTASSDYGEREYKVIFQSRLNSASIGYKASVQVVGTNEERTLVIFKDKINTIEAYCPMTKFVDSYKKGASLSLIGYEKVYYGAKQIVFIRPVPKERRDSQ